MPYPNEHAARIVEPNKFIDASFRRKNIANGIDIIMGKLKGGDGSMVTQAYRFDVDKFTATEAKKWLKDHDVDYISFEPAKPTEPTEKDLSESDIKENLITEEKDMSKIEYKTYAFELKELSLKKEDDGHQLGIFYGAMATEHKDRGGDIIAPEAFDKTLARYKKDNRNIRLFYQHQHNDLPIGIIPIESVSKNNKNWMIKGELNLDTQKGREVYSLMKQGALSDLSIGYSPIETEWVGKTRIIKMLELWEASIVSEPQNTKAVIYNYKDEFNNELTRKIEIDNVKSISTKKEFELILRESGIFSKQAAIYLASFFIPKQSESAAVKETLMDLLLELKDILSEI